MGDKLTENFYDILNIRKDATPEEIKRAYKNLAKQYHPDKNKSPEASEKFKMISRAHQVLSDPVERRKYDDAKSRGFEYDDNNDNSRTNFDSEYFKNMFRSFFPGFNDDHFTNGPETHNVFSNHMRSSETKNFSTREQTKEQNSTRNSEFGTKSYSTTFGRGGQKRKQDSFDDDFFTNEPNSTSYQKRPKQEPCSSATTNSCNNNNNNTNSSSSLKDSAIEKNLELSLEEIASGCTKKLKIKRKIDDGYGNCRQEEKLIEIPIKPGWKAGTKLTYPQLGDKFPGREPADITFILKDKPHALFSRDSDNNLLHTANVSLKKALLGVSYCIQGLNGKRHDINVKDIVHPGYVKRYPGEGMPLPKTPSRRGDLIVTFDIQFPTFLSWDQRRVLSDCLPN